MKNTFFRLIALGSAATALFAFTTPNRNAVNRGPSYSDTSAIVRTDSTAFNDSSMVKDSSIAKDSTKIIASTSIKGKVYPIDAATEVWAISGTDSLKVSVTDGAFTFDAKPGTYKIVVVAKVPFKDVIKDNVQVADGNMTDLGTIKLQQ